MKQSVTVGAQLLWSGRYGCNNGRYGCTIVMSYIEINKAVSQWLLTFNLCVSVTWPLTCAFHIPCTHTPEIIDMHRGMCDNIVEEWYIKIKKSLHWRHNGQDGVPNHQPHNCLLNRLFWRGSKKTSKLRVTGLSEWNSHVTDEFPAQMASNAENFQFDDVII